MGGGPGGGSIFYFFFSCLIFLIRDKNILGANYKITLLRQTTTTPLSRPCRAQLRIYEWLLLLVVVVVVVESIESKIISLYPRLVICLLREGLEHLRL